MNELEYYLYSFLELIDQGDEQGIDYFVQLKNSNPELHDKFLKLQELFKKEDESVDEQ